MLVPRANVRRSAIDRLPPKDKKEIMDALIMGRPCREIAKKVGVSFQAVADYRRRHIVPAMKLAAVQGISKAKLDLETIEANRQAVEATEANVRASVVRSRVESLWKRIDRTLDNLENRGDQHVMGPIFNAAHKNVQLLGQLTGELTEQAATNLQIQIVIPAGGTAAAAEVRMRKSSEPEVIDILPTRES